MATNNLFFLKGEKELKWLSIAVVLTSAFMLIGVASACGVTFDGTNYLQIPTNPRLDSLSTHVVICGMFKLTQSASVLGFGEMIWSKGPSNRIFVDSYNHLTYSVDTGQFYPYETTNNLIIKANKWYEFTATYRVSHGYSDITLQVNGKISKYHLAGEYPMLPGQYDIVLGANSDHTAFWMYGTIARISVNGKSINLR